MGEVRDQGRKAPGLACPREESGEEWVRGRVGVVDANGVVEEAAETGEEEIMRALQQ